MAPALALWAASAVAEFHTYKIEEIFSNADGTIQYAENPPKKYQDIYPFDFESTAWKSLSLAMTGENAR